jgi:putative nucleotidyltransferase with HDIG domain
VSIFPWEEFRERSIWEYELKIAPADLKLGHYVRQLSIPWEKTDSPFQGMLVDSFKKKKWLQDHCDWVIIDLDRSSNQYRPAVYARHDRASHGDHMNGHAIHILSKSSIGRQTLTAAVSTYHRLDQQAEHLVQNVSANCEIDILKARGLIGEMAEALDENLAALVWLSRIKQRDRYTAQHCVNVAILSMGLAASLGWIQREVEMAGLAGLLHDLGKMQVDLQILNKKGRLTPEEYEHVKRHCMLGYKLLADEVGVPEAVAMAVLTHHERPDGTGYPQGLDGDQVSPLSRLVSIIDAYDAITSHRVYDPARSHHQALGILWKNRGTQFDKDIVESLTRFMGWVTPGTLVRLSNDGLAVVMKSPSTRGFLPLVRTVRNDENGLRLGPELDLAGQRAAGILNPLRIVEVLPDGHAGIDMRKLTAQLIELI